MKIFDSRTLSGISVPEREEMKIGWRNLHNVELHSVHTTPNIITL
jgi:hypothetical protein